MGENVKSVYFVVQVDNERVEDWERETFIRVIQDDENYKTVPAKRVTGATDLYVAKSSLPFGWQVIQAGVLTKDGEVDLDESTHVFNVETDHLVYIHFGKTMKKLRLYPGNQVLFVNFCPDDMGRLVVMGHCTQLGWFNHCVALKQEHVLFPQGTIYSIPIVEDEDNLPFKLAYTDGSGVEWEGPAGHYKKVTVPQNGDIVVCSTWGKMECHVTELAPEPRTDGSADGSADATPCPPAHPAGEGEPGKARGDPEADTPTTHPFGDADQGRKSPADLHNHLQVPEKSLADLEIKASLHVQSVITTARTAIAADGETNGQVQGKESGQEHQYFTEEVAPSVTYLLNASKDPTSPCVIEEDM